jgi:hypothetical protein
VARLDNTKFEEKKNVTIHDQGSFVNNFEGGQDNRIGLSEIF